MLETTSYLTVILNIAMSLYNVRDWSGLGVRLEWFERETGVVWA